MNPIYYVFFTTATIVASAILFQGFNTTDAVNTLSLICGFLVIFMGVYLLNISRQPEKPHHATSLEAGLMSESHWLHSHKCALVDVPDPRMSMSGRLSMDTPSNGTFWNYGALPQHATYAPDGSPYSASHGRRSSIYRAQNSTLFNAFEEEGVALREMPEDEDSDGDERETGRMVSSPQQQSAPLGRGSMAQGRSLVGKGLGGMSGHAVRGSTAEGGRHPAYGGSDGR